MALQNKMLTWSMAIYIAFSFHNMLALWLIYKPQLIQLLQTFTLTKNLLRSWDNVYNFYMSLIVLKYKQWINNSISRLPDGRVVVNFSMNGQIFKVVMVRDDSVEEVTDLEGETSFKNQAIPYLRYKAVPFSADLVEQEELIIHTKNDQIMC